MPTAPCGIALVTGGARRIGRVLVRTCAEAGYDVAIHCRQIDPDAESAAAEVMALGRRALLIPADLGIEAETTDLLDSVCRDLGPVTLLVNSASLFEEDHFSSMDLAGWQAHMQINLRLPLILSQAMSRQLLGSQTGLIVNLIDQRVLHPRPEFFSYSLSKTALWDATQMMALDLAPTIRVNAIAPGPVLRSIHQTEADFAAEAAQTPLARSVDPAEIGQALIYLIGAHSVTGQMICVDAGQHLT